MNIALFLDNRGFAGVDCGSPALGNPGIGGTEYSLILFAALYSARYPQDTLTLLHTAPGRLPPGVGLFQVPHAHGAVQRASEWGADLLLIQAFPDEGLLECLKTHQVKAVVWAHNDLSGRWAAQLSRCSWVQACVFVGRQQYDLYLDHPLIHKAAFIYNMYPQPGRGTVPPLPLPRGPVVGYMGALIPAKGFHWLAAGWQRVAKAVPGVQLWVMGSGALYDRRTVLGPHGLAQAAYEVQFMRHLLDSGGKPLPGVRFWGHLGPEKDGLIRQCRVGVVNPSGSGETFGISALDFLSRGIPVVAGARGGLLDTNRHGETGLLVRTKWGTSRAVARLLKDPVCYERCAAAAMAMARCFAPQGILSQWRGLFSQVLAGKAPAYCPPVDHYCHRFKWLRMLNRRLKGVKLFKDLPSVVALEYGAKALLEGFYARTGADR